MAKKATKAPGKAGKGSTRGAGAAPAIRSNQADVKRAAGGRFAPGVSGNPSGRPKLLAEVKALAAAHTQDAIDALAEIAKNPKALAVARVSAANALLDRAWGKPTQAVEMSGPEGAAVQVETKALPLGPEQVAELLHVLHEAGQLAGEKPGDGAEG